MPLPNPVAAVRSATTRRPLLAFAAAVVLLGPGGPGPLAEPAARTVRGLAHTACSIAVVDSRPIVLPDGRSVHLPVRNATLGGSRILLTGTPVVTWNGEFIRSDTLVAIVVDPTTATARAVRSPLAGRTATQLRVAPAREGGWHIVFLDTTGHGTANSAGFIDSATVWYGRLIGDAWSEVSRVAVAAHVKMSVQASPDLGADGDRLRFALAFQKPPVAGASIEGRNGALMFRRDAGRWTIDSLLPRYTRSTPSYIRLVKAERRRAWHVAMVQSYTDEVRRIGHPSSLFIVDYDSSWGAPSLLVSGDNGPVLEPTLVRLADGLIASWGREGRAGRRTEWARVTTTDSPLSPIAAVFETTREFGTIPVDSSTLLWHTRWGLSRDTVRIVLHRRGSVRDVGGIAVNNDSFTAFGVALSAREIVLFTSRVNRDRPGGPPAVTMVSRLALVCTD